MGKLLLFVIYMAVGFPVIAIAVPIMEKWAIPPETQPSDLPAIGAAWLFWPLLLVMGLLAAIPYGLGWLVARRRLR